ncbi:hypothetical protein [Flindersiella endophytica]
MDGFRRRFSRSERAGSSVPAAVPSQFDLEVAAAVAAARDNGRSEEARRLLSWLRHPSTVERVAEAFYEGRTGKLWRTAEEIDRIAYIANARAVMDMLIQEQR